MSDGQHDDERKSGSKGVFGRARLAVSTVVVRPTARRSLVVAALVALALVGLAFAADVLLRDARWVSNGALSTSHATLSEDCAACHDPATRSVTAERCSVCHERAGDPLGTNTWAAHYVYRSGDLRRVAAGALEQPCQGCHVEHGGRGGSLTRLASASCDTCHGLSDFGDHPEFDAVVHWDTDPAGVEFAHGPHLREVMERLGTLDPELACVQCHEPRPGGASFAELSFDRHCDACHLTEGIATPRLPVATGDEVGVLTLESIRSSGLPGTRWAAFTDPNEFRRSGPGVLKTTLHHPDPWVLHNLRRVRTMLYADAGIADLLDAAPDADPRHLPALYGEMLDRLEEDVIGLRGRPEPAVQAELRAIESVITTLRRRLEDPTTALDETDLLLSLRSLRPGLSEAEVAEWSDLALQLTTPCRTCHTVDRATISRVQTDQRTFLRAEFDHRSHVLQARCLDCHDRIPLERMLVEPDAELPDNDRSSVYNLPGRDTCAACHTAELAGDQCQTCHLFHPSRDRRADLLSTFHDDAF